MAYVGGTEIIASFRIGSGGGVTSLNGLTGTINIVAGANTTVTPGVGTITIASTGTIAGSIAVNQVAFGSGANTIQGSANLTFNGTTLTSANDAIIHGLTIGEGAGSVATNTALGASALAANTSGDHNTAVGVSALALNTTAQFNVAVGASALAATVTGSFNTAVGTNALVANTGILNVGVGSSALSGNLGGGSNTGLGVNALQANTTGSNNTAVGLGALITNTTGSNNSALGLSADVGSNALTFATAIGSGTVVATSNTVQIGRTAGTDQVTIPGVINLPGMTSGVAQLGVMNAAGTPNRINLPVATGAAGTFLQTDGANPQQTSWVALTGTTLVASGTATLNTAAIPAVTAATVVTVAGAGILSTDSIEWAFNATPGTGYTTGLHVLAFVSTGNVNFSVVNPTAGALTPAAATLNWRVVR